LRIQSKENRLKGFDAYLAATPRILVCSLAAIGLFIGGIIFWTVMVALSVGVKISHFAASVKLKRGPAVS